MTMIDSDLNYNDYQSWPQLGGLPILTSMKTNIERDPNKDDYRLWPKKWRLPIMAPIMRITAMAAIMMITEYDDNWFWPKL